MPATFALIPGAGGSAWYWHLVTPLLTAAGHDAIAVELPAADPTADLDAYADTVVRAVANAREPLVVVAQSMGAFTAPIVASRRPVAMIVLVNPMVPLAGESPGQWWTATGQSAARSEYFSRIGLGDRAFDEVEDYFHDVPAAVRAEALRQPEPEQADAPFERAWPLDAWPDVPTRVLQGSDDRLFPLEFQRRVARDRLGCDVDVMPGGHLSSLSQPQVLATRLLEYLSES